ncbi:unnamed protein product [Cercospora beticola]|nr:unnamed protein product [Cercospora beticola]
MGRDNKNGEAANSQGDRNETGSFEHLDRGGNRRLKHADRLSHRPSPVDDLNSAPRGDGYNLSGTYNAPGSKRYRKDQLPVPKNRTNTDAGGQVRIDSGHAILEENETDRAEDRTYASTSVKARYMPPGASSRRLEPSNTTFKIGAATDFVPSRKLDSNWRDGMNPLSPPKGFSESSPAYSTTRLTWRDFQNGDVFWAAWEVHSNRSNVDVKDPNLYPTYDGPKLIKQRLYICVSKTETFMQAVPIFSHNDGGIDKIPADRQYEYACISQVGKTDTARSHPGGLSMLWFDSGKGDFVLRKTSTAHLTATRPVLYDQPITVVGRLVEQSLTHLVNQISHATTQANRKYGQPTEKQQREARAAKTTAGLSQLTSRLGQMGRKFREERG